MPTTSPALVLASLARFGMLAGLRASEEWRNLIRVTLVRLDSTMSIPQSVTVSAMGVLPGISLQNNVMGERARIHPRGLEGILGGTGAILVLSRFGHAVFC